MRLVIGYGNELRGDDAVGPRVARTIATSNLPDLTTRAVAQLTPELAEPIARADRVVFVDAAVGGPAGAVEVLPVQAVDLRTPLGHLTRPPSLLALAQAVFGRSPPAWIVRVFGTEFGFHQGLSPDAEKGAIAAVEAVVLILGRPLDAGDDPHSHRHPHPHDPQDDPIAPHP